MVVFSPWALGGWPTWSVWTMNAAGYALWLLLIAKAGVRWFWGYTPPRWSGRRPAWAGRVLAVLTASLLLWSLVSAVNARAVVDLAVLRLVERPDYIPWLPHSFDGDATWFHFWTCLALAGAFWGARDWLTLLAMKERGPRGLERAVIMDGGPEDSAGFGPSPHVLPQRLERLLWTCCLNGAAVALVGMMSVLDQPARVLWLADHPTRQGGFFGPFWYRNNGAQYLNLLWPVCLGFWHAHYLRAADSGRLLHRLTTSPASVLLPCLALMMAGPFVTTSRGGSLIAGAVMLACLPVLIGSTWNRGRRLLAPLLLVPAGIALGLMVAGEPLANRLFREFRVFATGATAGLSEFTLRCAFVVPEPWGRGPVNVAGFSQSSQSFGDSPNTVLVRLLGEGVVSVRFAEPARERYLELRGTNRALAQPGRRVEVVLAQRHTNSTLYVDGTPLSLASRLGKAGFTWPSRFATQHLWVARGEGNPIIWKRIEAVTVLHRPLRAEEVPALSATEAAGSAGRQLAFQDAWEQLDPKPLFSVRPNRVSPFLWAAAGFGGRTRYYEDTRRMLAQYPAVWGAGPGTFASLYKVYLGDPRATDAWFVHDDYLEARFTYGWLGSALIHLLLAASLIPAFCRGGLIVPWYLGAFLLIGLCGCLLHAKFDFVFQTHPILFLAVLFCGVLSISTLRRGQP